MNCPNCHKAIIDEAKFCPYCASRIERKPVAEESHGLRCSSCGAPLEITDPFCGVCGALNPYSGSQSYSNAGRQQDGGYDWQYNNGYDQQQNGGYDRQGGTYTQQRGGHGQHTAGEVGQKFKDGAAKLGQGAAKVGQGVGSAVSDAHKKYNEAYTKDTRNSSLPKLADDEKVVKSYHCAKVKFPRCNGYLTVTNKRVIFHGVSGGSRVEKEVTLDSVSGLDIFTGRRFNFFAIILGVLSVFAGFKFIFDRYMPTFTGILLLALAVVLFMFFAVNKIYTLSIFSSKANHSPISIGLLPRTLFGNGALYTLSCTATGETDTMVSELGALISDLQEKGDHAIEKWNPRA